MNVNRAVVIASALVIVTGSVLVPAGAGAHTRPRRVSAPATWALNGSARRATVFVRCAPGATKGVPTPRNTVTSRVRRGLRNVRVTVVFHADRTKPVRIVGSGRRALPASLRLPCSGRGRVRIATEQVVRARRIPLRGAAIAAGLPFVRPAVGSSIRVLKDVTIPVAFVSVAS